MIVFTPALINVAIPSANGKKASEAATEFLILEDKIESQIARTRTSEEKSPKNAALYFSILQESKDLMKEVMSLIEEYYVSYDKSVKPAKPKDE